jgi:putative ABC transport system permease protein
VLADLAYADELGDDAPVTTRIFVRLDPDAVASEVAAEVLDILGPGVRATTPGSVLAELEEDPATAGLRGALIVGIALSALLAAVAVVITLVLGGRARRRILALLQTLGAPPRSGGGLVAWELAPATIAALVVGTAFGAALPVLLLAVIDLTPFTGGDRQPAYAVDPVILLAAVGGFIAVTVIFTFVALAITRRARAAAVLRTVEET